MSPRNNFSRVDISGFTPIIVVIENFTCIILILVASATLYKEFAICVH